MRFKLKPVAGLMLTVGALLLLSQLSLASRESEMERNRRENKKLYEKVGALQGKGKALDQEIKVIDQRFSAKEEDVNEIQRQLNEAENRQTQMVAERQQAMEQLDNYQNLLAKRARQVYMQGDLTYIDLLFQASSIEDFVDRVFFIQAILEQDNALITNTRSTRDSLTELLAAVDQQIASIAEIKAKLDVELAALNDIKQDKELLRSAIESDMKLHLKEIEENEAANKRLAAAIRASKAAGSGYKGEWKGKLSKPCPGPINSGFGYRIHPIFKTRRMHTGVDIGASQGTSIKAAAEGKVIFADWMSGYGNTVVVDHGGGRSTLYAHMSRITRSVGDEVTTSSELGKVGSTGNSTGPHLHFEVRINGDPIDPMAGSINW